MNESVDRLPWGLKRDGTFTRTGEALGFCLGILATFTCLPLGIAGIVLSCIGMDRVRLNLPCSHPYMRASWTCFMAAPLTTLAILLLISPF